MLKGATFTIGILLALGCGGFGVMSIMADGMSDNPTVADEDSTPKLCGIGLLIGVGMIVGAFFIP